jgi:RNA 2',3'-cyclic 3'-phosphodiesterase
MSEQTRSFMAMLLPEEMKAEAASLQRQVKDRFPPGSVKWVDPTLFHLTVRFYGYLDRKALEKATTVVQEMENAWEPVAVRLTEVSAFPSPARPQVIWIGVEDRGDRLSALAAEIDRRIRAAGFGPADKPWKSHLTIGRAGRDRNLRLGPEWTAGLTWKRDEFMIRTVALMRSDLRPQGPTYTPLRIAPASS